MLSGKGPSAARAMRKLLDAKPPPAESESEKATALKEAVNMFPAALHEGDKAEPSYEAFLEPKHSEAPWALKDAARKRAADQ